jgi:hypothetical protein
MMPSRPDPARFAEGLPPPEPVTLPGGHTLHASHSGFARDPYPYCYRLVDAAGREVHSDGWFATLAEAIEDAADRVEARGLALDWISADERELAPCACACPDDVRDEDDLCPECLAEFMAIHAERRRADVEREMARADADGYGAVKA